MNSSHTRMMDIWFFKLSSRLSTAVYLLICSCVLYTVDGISSLVDYDSATNTQHNRSSYAGGTPLLLLPSLSFHIPYEHQNVRRDLFCAAAINMFHMFLLRKCVSCGWPLHEELFLPFACLASDNPIAISCLRLFTLVLLPRILKIPSLNSCITFFIFFATAFPYFLMI